VWGVGGWGWGAAPPPPTPNPQSPIPNPHYKLIINYINNLFKKNNENIYKYININIKTTKKIFIYLSLKEFNIILEKHFLKVFYYIL